MGGREGGGEGRSGSGERREGGREKKVRQEKSEK